MRTISEKIGLEIKGTPGRVNGDIICGLEKQRNDLLELVMKIHSNIYEPDKIGIIIDKGMKDVTGLLFRDVKKRLAE